MKKADVKVGGRYYANVSGKRVEVRIEAEKSNGGWDATNLATGKKVHIKSAQRLQGEVGRSGKTTKSTVARHGGCGHQRMPAGRRPRVDRSRWRTVLLQVQRAGARQGERQEGQAERLSEGKEAQRARRGGQGARRSHGTAQCQADDRGDGSDKGYWKSPGGKTPHATLYSAILREIDAKGDAARFRKTDRGKFATNA